MQRFWSSFRWFILWTLVIIALSAIPGGTLKIIVTWGKLLTMDKLAHATIYFIQTFFLVHALAAYLPRPAFRHILLAMGICISFGLLIEVAQGTLFSQRSMDWLDAVANAEGAILAGIYGFFLYRKINRKRANH